MRYVELHAHSAYSFLDGASSPEELAAAAAVHGYRRVALTDHDGLWGAMEFAHACKGLGRQGDHRRRADARRRLAPHPARREPHRLLATSAGCSRSRTRDTRANPRERTPPQLSLEQLERHAEGLVCLSGCARDGAARAPGRARRPDEAERLGRRLLAAFGRERFRVELQRPFWRRDRARNRALAAARRAARRRRAWRPATSTPTTPTAPACRTRSSPCACARRSTRPSPSGAATRTLGDGVAGRDGGALPRPSRTRSPRRRGSPSGSSSTSRATSATAIPARRTPTPTASWPSSAGRGSASAIRDAPSTARPAAAWTRSCA